MFSGHLVSPAHFLVILTPANPDVVPGHVKDVGRLPPGHSLQSPAVVRRILTGSCHGDGNGDVTSAKVETGLARIC